MALQAKSVLRYFRIFSMFAVMFLSAISCGDFSKDDETTKTVSIQFNFSSNDGETDSGTTKAPSTDQDPADFTVYSLDVLAITSSSGIITGRANVDLGPGGTVLKGLTQNVDITVPQGNVEFAVIANLSATDKTRIASILTKNQLLQFISDKPTTDPKLLMSHLTDATNILATGQSVQAPLERASSRIQLLLDKKNISEEIIIKKVTIKNVPAKSFVLHSTTSTASEADISIATNATIAEENASSTIGEFVCETPVFENHNGTKPTYLIIEGTYAGADTKYTVYLNDSNTATPAAKVFRNTIYRLYATIVGTGELNAIKVGINILPWTTKNYTIDVSQTRLEVGKTTVELSYQDVIPVTTNTLNNSYTATADNTWLVPVITAGGLQITADRASYPGTPRSTKLRVTANNVTKVIDVIQRPDGYTISPVATTLYLAPVLDHATRTISVVSKGAGWSLTGGAAGYATISPTSGATATTGTNVTFTRGATFGNTTYTLANTETLDKTTITVCNLNLTVPTKINVNGSGGSIDNEQIIAVGGDATFTVVGNNSGGWITTSIVGGQLRLTATAAPTEAVRTCTITVAHSNDLDYTKTIIVEQDIHTIISPPFMYLTGRMTTDLREDDVDIAVLIYDDHGKSLLPVNGWLGANGYYGIPNRPVTEYGVNYDWLYKGVAIARYGGDPNIKYTDTQYGFGESFVIYPKAFDDLVTFPLNQLDQFINIYFYAWWWTRCTDPTKKAYLELFFWDQDPNTQIPISFEPVVVNDENNSNRAYHYLYKNAVNVNKDPGKKDIFPMITNNSTTTSNARLSTDQTMSAILGNDATNSKIPFLAKIVHIRYDRVRHVTEMMPYIPAKYADWPTTNIAHP